MLGVPPIHMRVVRAVNRRMQRADPQRLQPKRRFLRAASSRRSRLLIKRRSSKIGVNARLLLLDDRAEPHVAEMGLGGCKGVVEVLELCVDARAPQAGD